MVQLSEKAIKDLRSKIRNSYGAGFELALTDAELQEIGNALLLVTAEYLKVKVLKSR